MEHTSQQLAHFCNLFLLCGPSGPECVLPDSLRDKCRNMGITSVCRSRNWMGTPAHYTQSEARLVVGVQGSTTEQNMAISAAKGRGIKTAASKERPQSSRNLPWPFPEPYHGWPCRGFPRQGTPSPSWAQKALSAAINSKVGMLMWPTIWVFYQITASEELPDMELRI